ncbi:MAG: hypothetical protein ACREB3_12880, partial [Burkholderiales bacterium]
RLPMPAVQGVLFALTALLLVLYFKAAGLRAWIDALEPRSLVLLHVTRFVGIYFLILYQRGELPYAFAVPGGWGDIGVASLALLLCFLPLQPAARHHALAIWNALGFADIMMVVVTAGRLGLQGEPLMRNLTVLPLSLLPTFLVPLIIATHIILYLRLRRAVPTA